MTAQYYSIDESVLLVNVPPTQTFIMPATGIRYLYSYLKMNKIEVNLLDLNACYDDSERRNRYILSQYDRSYDSPDGTDDFVDVEQLRSSIRQNIEIFRYFDILAFSILEDRCSVVFGVIERILKEEGITDKKIMVGGSFVRHPKNSAKLIESHKMDENFFVCGEEGEYFFQKMFGLPEFELYSYLQYYHKEMYGHNGLPSVVYSTGCVNKCKFCNHRHISPDIWYRDINTTVNEMRYFSMLGKKEFFIRTDNMSNNIKHLNKFTEKLKDLNVLWTANFSPRVVYNEDINFDNLKKSGCRYLRMGVESMCRDTRISIGKDSYTNEDIYKLCDSLLEHDIKIQINIMIGFMTETEREFEICFNNLRDFCVRYKSVIYHICASLYIVYGEEGYCGYEVEFDSDGYWKYGDNTFDVRKKRYVRILELLKELDVRASLQIEWESTEAINII